MTEPARAIASNTVRILAGFAAAYLGVATFYAASAAIGDAGLSAPRLGPATPELRDLPLLGAALMSMVTALALAARLRGVWALAALLLISFGAQIGWAAWIDAQPFGALGVQWEAARRLAAEPSLEILFSSPAPMAVAVYATAVKLFGPDLDAARIVAAALWTMQTALVWLIARQLSEVKSAALAAAAAVALTPAAVVYGAMPSIEAVFGPLALGGLYLVLSHRSRGLILSVLLAGALLAMAFLTKPTAAAFAAAIFGVLGIALIKSRTFKGSARLVAAMAALAVGASAALAPVLIAQRDRDVSVVAKLAPTLGFELMFGVNQASGGAFAVSDLEAVGYAGPTEARASFGEAEVAARSLAWSRVAEAPLGVTLFAATEKMRKLWSSQRDLLDWTLAAPSAQSAVVADPEVRARLGAVVDGAYLATLILATLGAIALAARGAVIDPSRWLILLGAFVGLALMHGALEADSRRHLAATPLAALLGGYALCPQPRRRRVAAENRADAAAPSAPSREELLAGVFAQMSKPPRREADGGGSEGRAVAPRRPATAVDRATEGRLEARAETRVDWRPVAPARGVERREKRDAARAVSAPR